MNKIPLPRLSSEERRRRAGEFILSGIVRGLSGRTILKILQEHGLGYRRGDFYRDLRMYKEALSLPEDLLNYPSRFVIDPELMPHVKTRIVIGKWMMRIEYTIKDSPIFERVGQRMFLMIRGEKPVSVGELREFIREKLVHGSRTVREDEEFDAIIRTIYVRE